MLGSHNTFTYQKCTKWWLRPFQFVARCQQVNPYVQYTDYDVRLFDIRVRFVKGKPVIAHGLIEYPYDKVEMFLDWLNYSKDSYVRLILEFNKQPEDYKEQIALFKDYCDTLQREYSNIKFFGGRSKWDWTIIYSDFKHPEPSLDDKYSSTQPPFKYDDWWPWFYARFHNKKNKKLGTDKDFLFIDFVNI